MDFNQSKDNNHWNIDMWEWEEEDYSLPREPQLGGHPSLWDVNDQSEDSLLYMLGDHTPIKDCRDFGFDILDLGDKAKNKGLEENRGSSSQVKRRRMLQFSSDAGDITAGNEQLPSEAVNYKEDSMTAVDWPESLQWNQEWSSSFSDYRYLFSNEVLDQSEDGWLDKCFDESEASYQSPNGMSSSRTDIINLDDQVDVSGLHDVAPEASTVVPKTLNTSTLKIFRGRKSFINTPTKLSTSVAYPFTLIKPSELQGKMTLKDINQRIHTPPPSRSKQKKDESAIVYPTSAFSGKPVVVKTKIRTEGGKGSITILRTKG